jgi:hypothetical protein
MYYDGENLRSETREALLTLRSPTAEEADLLAMLLPQVELAGSFSRWWIQPGDCFDDRRASPEAVLARQQLPTLRFLETVRFLEFGPEAPEHVDPKRLGGLPAFYAPEVAAWRAEIAASRVQPAELLEQIARVKIMHPGLSHWMDRLAAGTSELQFARRSSGSKQAGS